jgi:DNA-binding NarL/FixJ family response regulator
VLGELKAHEELKKIPVVIFTTSSDPQDVDHCYQQGANSYMVKPVDFDGLVDALRCLSRFWFTVVLFPKLT